ncbi:hypothetical protein TRVA0_039S01090 [Trichomonascus vanleenenianus]|uniref:F-box protein n=1 Tax=Trichomonascus vanleenenianus TaxID=2268995 RepID=UPI003ECB1A7B
MEIKMDFLRSLPDEISYNILGLLHPQQWRKLRLVSRNWNDLCERLVWRKVAIVPSNWSDVPVGYYLRPGTDFDALCPEYLKGEMFMLPNPERLKELASNWPFQFLTKELDIYYNPHLRNQYDESVFEVITKLFRLLNRVNVSYYSGPHNSMFLAFQKMLNSWKHIAEFGLGLTVIAGVVNPAFIDIAGMKIRELSLFKCPKPLREYPLPLSMTHHRIPVKWEELSTLSELATLSIESGYNLFFRPPWISEALRRLHLSGGQAGLIAGE